MFDFYRNIFNESADLCLITNEIGTIIDANRVSLWYLGYFLEELIHTDIRSLVAEEYHSILGRCFGRFAPQKTDEIMYLSTRSGCQIPVKFTVTCLSGKKQEGFLLFCFKDITEIEELKFKIHHLEGLSHVGFWEYDPLNKMMRFSEKACEIYGKFEEGRLFLYEEFLESIHEEDRSRIEAFFLDPEMQLRRKKELKHRVASPGRNEEAWVSEKILDVRTYNKKSVVLGVVREAPPMERVFGDFEGTRQIVGSSIYPMLVTDSKGKITYVNSKMEEFYGYRKKDLVGQSPHVFNPGRSVYYDMGYSPAAYEQLFSDLWEKILDPDVGFWEGEILNTTKEGKLLHVYLFIHSVKNPDGSIYSYVGTPVDLTKQHEKENEIRIGTYKAIADLAEKRDNETGRHMARIGEYSYLLAKSTCQTNKFCSDIRIFSPLHDIGKVGISDDILLAPRKLTNKEYSIMKTHTSIGYNILKNRPTLEMASEISYFHHEKFDGTGYPLGIAGDEIPLSARICSIVDSYDALRNERPYKKAFSEDETISILKDGRGRFFDPDLLDEFLENLSDYNEIVRPLFS